MIVRVRAWRGLVLRDIVAAPTATSIESAGNGRCMFGRVKKSTVPDPAPVMTAILSLTGKSPNIVRKTTELAKSMVT